MNLQSARLALFAILQREVVKFWYQRGRLLSALVRPGLWLLVFAAGFQNVFGLSIIPPYETYITYQVYVVPGLLGMILLFNGMQSSLSLVYDREMGLMRLLLTAPLPRWFFLLCKILAGSLLSILQAYAFLLLCYLFNIRLPGIGFITILLPLFLTAFMLGALGLILSVYVKQLENFAGTMNFVIFPMFFMSTALYPLWKLDESGAEIVYRIAQFNPLSHGIEFIRFAFYGQFNLTACLVVVCSSVLFFLIAAIGYNPQAGFLRGKKPAR